MKFNKPSLSIPALCSQWQARGLLIHNQAEAEHYLRFIGYYRLSAYALPLQDRGAPLVNGLDKPFKPNTSFDDILNLYRFDRELRLLFIDAIERIEVAFRTATNSVMCEIFGPHWFMDSVHFQACQMFNHNAFLNKIEEELHISAPGRTPDSEHLEVFINHYYARYTQGPSLPPGWMIAEVLTLGSWSKIFANLADINNRKSIAKHFRTDERVLKNWVHALTYLRNICAHHCRIWNRLFVIKPIIAFRHAKMGHQNERCYAMAVVIEDLLKTIAPGTSWGPRLKKLIAEHPFADPAAMGFPPNWQDDPFWN